MSARRRPSRKVSARYASHPLVERGLRYAEDVVAGQIPAGRFCRLACARQLADLRKAKRSNPFVFDAEEATRICMIVQELPHTKGKWAAARAEEDRKITLEPWQLFIFGTLFGWVEKKTGLRRFREAFVSVPRKNGKSLIAAALGIVMLAFDGEVGAEVYCGATTEKQAWEVFKPARVMVLKTPDLRDEYSIEPLARSLTVAADGAKFEPIIGDPGDGQSPSCAIIDEYHEHKTPEQYDTMASGMGARDAPLMFVITTAGVMHGGPCYDHQRDAERVLEGVIANERLFVMVFHADADDDWADPATLRKANPNVGVSVGEEYLLARQRDAISIASRQNVFRTKHLNQWVGARQAFLNLAKWKKCRTDEVLEDFAGRDCMVALDLASKSDIAVVQRLFWDGPSTMRSYWAFPRMYIPEAKLTDDKTGRYAGWVKQGLITVTDGDEIDFRVIRSDVEADMARFNVVEVAYDPWRATQLSHELAEAGATCVEYRNTIQQMSEPMKEWEASVNSGRFHHDGNEAFAWHVSNVVNKIDRNSNYFPNKEKPEMKIDAAVATIMGIGRLLYREDDRIDDWLAAGPITA